LALPWPAAGLAGALRRCASLPSAPTADQATTSRLVYGLLSDSRYAYRPRALDDALSKDILKRYLESLDPGKVFLTAQDVASFEPLRDDQLDDAIKGGQVDPGWAIFAVYRSALTSASPMRASC
jgi:carboxyl-terminal processing protease